jgi:ribosomal protein S8
MDSKNNENQTDSIMIEGFDNKSANELSIILKRFLNSYRNKEDSITDREWLKNQFKMELPELSDSEVEKLSEECFEQIETFDKNLKSINHTIENGGTKEGWFSKKVQEASIGQSINEYGNYLSSIDNSIKNANAQMLRVVTNMDGSINQNMNLDGFMAEQHHVNSFNMNSKLNGSNYKAEVLVPKAGETYGKNSFDVVIRDNNGKIVHQYQMKYGATAQDTIRMIKNGNYNNQRIVVPPEQLDEVRKGVPSKTIVSSIGGTDLVNTASNPLRKDEAKKNQLDVQKEGIIRKEDWNHFKTKELTVSIAKNASVAGVQAAIITTGFDMARRAISGEKFDADETIELAIRTGTDAGIKAAATGAVKVGVEKGIVSVIPKGTPVGVIANVVCVGIENVKILSKVATGDLTMTQALDRMGRTTTSMVYGIGWGATSSLIGAAALAWIPIVGPVIGGFVGGMVGYMAGSKFGEAVYNTGKKIVSTAKKAVSRVWEGVKSAGRSLKRAIFG